MMMRLAVLFLSLPLLAQGPLVTLTEPVQTEFGVYRPYPATAAPRVPAYGVDEALANVSNAGRFSLAPEQKALLHAQGFFATPFMGMPSATGYNEMYDLYMDVNESGLPVFVSSDVVLHAYHRFFDDILQTVEETRFSPALNALDADLFAQAVLWDNPLRTPSTTLLAAYEAVALKLLDPAWEVPAEYATVVAQEVALIEAHQGYELSPLFQAYFEDYSQYKPRGHYTKSETLKRYFKAMMWHGRMTFVLRDALGTARPDLTGAALLLTQALARTDRTAAWRSLYVPTVFFVGKSDDFLYTDYLAVARMVYGDGFDALEPAAILDPAMVAAFIAAAEEALNPPDITTQTGPGLRFMGQRFIPDSYMFTQLTYPSVEDRYLPKGLDVMALLGSDRAQALLEEMGETAYPGYPGQFAKLQDYIAQQPPGAWAQNLYWNWLYALMPLLYPKGEGYPFFMTNPAWEIKDLNAALGSWTELRHDTILYAKQSSSGTGYPPEYYAMVGYVEPNPELYSRLASLTVYTREGLDRFGLLTQDTLARLDGFSSLLWRLMTMAEKELTNLPLSIEEQGLLSRFGFTLRDLLTAPGEPVGTPEEDPMPIVADVHTDPNSATCLEEGVGYPLRLVVAVPIGGRVYLSVGAALAYYEFPQPIADRLTDEQWRDRLTSAAPPEPPAWTQAMRDPEPLANPMPRPYYPGKRFIDIPVTWHATADRLVLRITPPIEAADVQVTFQGVALAVLSASASEIVYGLPSPEQAPDGSVISIRIEGHEGLFEINTGFVLDRIHIRPSSRPD